MAKKSNRVYFEDRIHTHCVHDVNSGFVYFTMPDRDLDMFRKMLSVLVAQNPDNRTLLAYQSLFNSIKLD